MSERDLTRFPGREKLTPRARRFVGLAGLAFVLAGMYVFAFRNPILGGIFIFFGVYGLPRAYMAYFHRDAEPPAPKPPVPPATGV